MEAWTKETGDPFVDDGFSSTSELGLRFDPSQERVLSLEKGEWATVLGAAGTGKTTLVVELLLREARAVFAREHKNYALLRKAGERNPKLPGPGGHAIALAQSRATALRIRERFEENVSVPVRGTYVRTPAALAFSIVNARAQKLGHPPITLATGTWQDRYFAQAVQEEDPRIALPAALISSKKFRTELRNFVRICDDYALNANDIDQVVQKLGKHEFSQEFVPRWQYASACVQGFYNRLKQSGMRTSSGLLREAAEIVYGMGEEEIVELPHCVYIDDAQDVAEGALGLLAALAYRGVRLVSFGNPDTATGSFQGERTECVNSIADAVHRKCATSFIREHRVCVLEGVYRAGEEMRALVKRVESGIGVAGAAEHRKAVAVSSAETPEGDTSCKAPATSVVSAICASEAEKLQTLTQRLQAAYYGINRSERIAWNEMAVLCRSRREAQQIAQACLWERIPAHIVGGGTVLADHALTHSMLSLALGALTANQLSFRRIEPHLTGPFFRFTTIELRRLRTALMSAELTFAQEESREARSYEHLCEHIFSNQKACEEFHQIRSLCEEAEYFFTKLEAYHAALENFAESFSLHRLIQQLFEISADGEKILARENDRVQERTLPIEEDSAESALEAVRALLFIVERFETQLDEQIQTGHKKASTNHTKDANLFARYENFVRELLESRVAQDTLGNGPRGDSVTIATPQGAVGQEFTLVCLTELQHKSWPNMRPRSSMLGLSLIERCFRGNELLADERLDTLHDELRLLLAALTRSKRELFAVAVENDQIRKSTFWQYFSPYEEPLQGRELLHPRMAVASLRAQLERDATREENARALAVFAQHNLPAASPQQWYGTSPQTDTSLFELDPQTATYDLRIGPSSLASAEKCPLSWALSFINRQPSTHLASEIGTVVHGVFERLAKEEHLELEETIETCWNTVSQELLLSHTYSPAELQRYENMLRHLVEAVISYEKTQRAKGWQSAGAEVSFECFIDDVSLCGKIDRVIYRQEKDGIHVRIIDLKTGKNRLTLAETEEDLQLLAYQYAFLRGYLCEQLRAENPDWGEQEVFLDGATLVYAHPLHALKRAPYSERHQSGMTDEMADKFADRVRTIVDSISGNRFFANVAGHCEIIGSYADCDLYLIREVSCG